MAAAGPQAELAPLVAKLREEGVFVRELSTLGIAYHSPALDPFCGRLRTRAPSQTSKALLHSGQRSPKCRPAGSLKPLWPQLELRQGLITNCCELRIAVVPHLLTGSVCHV